MSRILGFITGVLWGLYAATILFLYLCVSDPIQSEELNPNEYNDLLEKIKEECIREEHPTQAKIFRGNCLLMMMNIIKATNL